MNEWGAMGRVLVIMGVVLVVLGLLLAWGPRMPWLGHLPGDFSFGGPHGRVYVPLGPSIVLSVVLSLVLSWVGRR